MISLRNIYTVARKEIVSSFRDRIFVTLLFILCALLITAAFAGFKNYSQIEKTQLNANAFFRHELEEQQHNPHAAAHFGTYLFKPFSLLVLYDPGLVAFTGNTYQVEAHKQHEINYAAIQDRDASMRFGQLSIALILQLFFPLLIIFIGFSTITAEREQQTLKLILIQGINKKELVWGKFSGIYGLVLLAILPVFVLMLLNLLIAGGSTNLFSRLLMFMIVYLLYFSVITGIVVCLSAWSGSSKSALLKTLGIWVLFCVLLPRIGAAVADHAYKLPTRYDFNRSMQRGFSKGINKDGNYIQRAENFDQELIKRYHLDSIQQLNPSKRNGLQLQYGEDYNLMLFKKYSAPVTDHINAQQRLQDMFGILDPVISIKQLSMSFAGTDFLHHLDFFEQAQQYRNEFMATLNFKEQQGKMDPKDFPIFFKKIKKFDYLEPSATWPVKKHLLSLSALLFWFLSIILILNLTAKYLKVS